MMSLVHLPSFVAGICGGHTLICTASGALHLLAFFLRTWCLSQDVFHPNLLIFVYAYLDNFYTSARALSTTPCSPLSTHIREAGQFPWRKTTSWILKVKGDSRCHVYRDRGGLHIVWSQPKSMFILLAGNALSSGESEKSRCLQLLKTVTAEGSSQFCSVSSIPAA